jgi:hypothetical protein
VGDRSRVMSPVTVKSHRSPCIARVSLDKKLAALTACYKREAIARSPTCSSRPAREETPWEARQRFYRWLPRGRGRKEQLKDIARERGHSPDNAEAARHDLFHEFPEKVPSDL